jgi:hypothetical protein
VKLVFLRGGQENIPSEYSLGRKLDERDGLHAVVMLGLFRYLVEICIQKGSPYFFVAKNGLSESSRVSDASFSSGQI